MADISVMNVGGTDYNIKDSTSRTNSTKAMSLPAYYETGNTASQAYSVVGTPINWKGTLYYTKTTVAKGATWTVGTNLTAATNLGKLVRNIKTYVGSDSKLHFVDLTGADTALNFSPSTPSTLHWYKYFISNSAAAKITDANVGDIIILCPYNWSSADSYNTLTKSGLQMLYTYGQFTDFMTRKNAAEGNNSDDESAIYRLPPFIVYAATSTTITISRSGGRYMIIRISDK